MSFEGYKSEDSLTSKTHSALKDDTEKTVKIFYQSPCLQYLKNAVISELQPTKIIITIIWNSSFTRKLLHMRIVVPGANGTHKAGQQMMVC